MHRVSSARPKLLFLFADDRFFWSHRLSVARAAQRNGYEVIIATGSNHLSQQIKDEGFRLIQVDYSRKNHSLLYEWNAVRQIRQVYRQEQPEILHHVAIKPILYGSIAGLGLQYPTVNALTGLGYLVASSSRKAAILRAIIWRAFRFFLNRSNQFVLVENEDDKHLVMSHLGIPVERVIVTRGSGVDIDRFNAAPEPGGVPVVALASRMLWIKGIAEFVEAARVLRSRKVEARFVLVGDSDSNNPSCVSRDKLLEWHRSGIVEWWGYRSDMWELFKRVSIVCLPSHGGEGVPKVLMEAAASGRAIVTTNVPGCREIVRSGINGILVEPRNSSALAQAIEQLLKDPVGRSIMAIRSRELAVAEFSEEAVAQQTLALYGDILRVFYSSRQ